MAIQFRLRDFTKIMKFDFINNSMFQNYIADKLVSFEKEAGF
jgi:hypothetical protein